MVRRELPEDLLIAVLTGLDNAADHWLVDQWEILDEATGRPTSTCHRCDELVVDPPELHEQSDAPRDGSPELAQEVATGDAHAARQDDAVRARAR